MNGFGYSLTLLYSSYDRVYGQLMPVGIGLRHALASIDIDWDDLIDELMLTFGRFFGLRSFAVAIRRVKGPGNGPIALEMSCRLHHCLFFIHLLLKFLRWLFLNTNSQYSLIIT